MREKAKPMYAYFLGLISTIYILMIKGVPLFYFFVLLGFFLFGSIQFKADHLLKIYLIFMSISFAINMLTGSFKKTILISTVFMCIIIFSGLQAGNQEKDVCRLYFRGLKHSCYIQLIWCIVQFLTYRVMNLDINKLIFVQILHVVPVGSRYVEGKLVLSGLCWHPSNLVPVIIILLTMTNSVFVFGWCFIIILLTHSTTSLLAIILVLCLKIVGPVLEMTNIKISKKYIYITCLVCVGVLCVLVVSPGIREKVLAKIAGIIGRILGGPNDHSTNAHKSYYLLFPSVVRRLPLKNLLFGVGMGCSGLPITMITGQYQSMGAWLVESDIMNNIYGIGVCGAIAFYGWLIHLLKGKLEDRMLLMLLIIPIIISGITYNIQYYWVVYMEVILMCCQLKTDCNLKELFEIKEKTIWERLR